MMESTARMVGYLAAHGIWSVSEGGPLTPMLGTEDPDGGKQLARFMTGELETAVAQARGQLEANPGAAARGAIVYDGYLTLGDRRLDAIFIEAREYGDGRTLEMAVPYRSAEAEGGFAVFKPKLLAQPEGVADLKPILAAFWAGVDEHTRAAAVWNAHLDQSL